MPEIKPTTTKLAPAPAPQVSFKNAAERQARLGAFLLRCKLKLVSDLEKGDPQQAVEFCQKAGYLLPNETAISEANELQLFPSVRHEPGAGEPDGEWWLMVGEAVAKDALAIKRAFESFQNGDQLEGATVSHEADQQDFDPVPAGALTLNITVEQVTSKSGTKKDGTTWTRWGVKDQNDLWYSTFSSRVGKHAEALQRKAATIFFTTTDKGNDLHKIIPA